MPITDMEDNRLGATPNDNSMYFQRPFMGLVP